MPAAGDPQRNAGNSPRGRPDSRVSHFRQVANSSFRISEKGVIIPTSISELFRLQSLRSFVISAARRRLATPMPRPSFPRSLMSEEGQAGFSSWWEQPFLLKVVDLGLMAILVVAPFLMGGRQALGQIVLCALSAGTAVVWSLYQWNRGDGRWKFTGVEPIMLLGIGLILLQCCQLSPGLIDAVSPRVHRLLTGWDGNEALMQGVWNRISFTPSDTWSDLIVVTACLLFFFVAVQRLSTLNDLELYLRCVAIGGGAMALFGLVQYLASNGKFYWIYDHPMTDTRLAAKGAFTNANHFANYLAMAIPAQFLLIVLHRDARHSPNFVGPVLSRGTLRQRVVFHLRGLDPVFCLWCGLLLVTCLAILCSQSRIGLLSGCGGVLLALVIFWYHSLLTLRQISLGVGLILIGLLAMPLLDGSLAGSNDSVESMRLASDVRNMPVRHAGHSLIWKANLNGIREFPLVGTGLGSHHEVYWLWFKSPQEGVEYSHAENGYLQIAMETGMIGLGLVILLWMTSLLWCAQGLWHAESRRAKGMMAILTAGLLISLLQSMIDFVWYVPACVNVVLLYAICAWRISLMRFFEPTSLSLRCRTSTWNLTRLSWACMIPVLSGLGYWMIQEKLPELASEPIWDEYLRVTLAQAASAEAPGAAVPVERQSERIELALAAARANPSAQRMQLHAGLACLNQFALNQAKQQHHMPLSQIRDAARSLFTSTDEMNQWLNRPGVLGSERKLLDEAIEHFRASLNVCPLQPRPYLELAELIWLEGANGKAERDLVEQAVLSRPGDARALFAMGRMLWLNGEHKAAAEHWQYAFRQDTGYRGHLITSLASYVPARFFLDYFEPDHDSLMQLREAYRTSDDLTGYQLVLESLARSSMRRAGSLREAAAEKEWSLAHQCFAELGDAREAYRCGREAIIANPKSYAAHHQFGVWLYQNGYFAESVDELTWCLNQRPQESRLADLRIQARDKLRSTLLPTRMAKEPARSIIR